MLQLLTSVLVFIAALHVVHAECTPKKHETADQLELVCERSDLTPIKDANWFKDGVPLSNSTDPNITIDGQSRVTISPVPKNEGNYSCNSSTDTMVEQCFIVQVPPIITSPSNKTYAAVPEGATFNINCSIEVGNITRKKIVDSGKKMVKWIIKTCNSNGQCQNKTVVNQTESLYLTNQRKNATEGYIQYTCNIIGHSNINWIQYRVIYKQPSVNTLPKVFRREGESVTLNCSTTLPTSTSDVSFVWLKGGVSVTNSSTHPIVNHQNSSQLTIHNVTQEDAAVYTCMANFSLGTPAEKFIPVNSSTSLSLIAKLSKFQMIGCPTENVTLEFSTALPMKSKVTATLIRIDKNETVDHDCAGMSECNFAVQNFVNSTLVIRIRIEGNTWELATHHSPQCVNEEVELTIELGGQCPQEPLDELRNILKMKLMNACTRTNARVCPELNILEASCNNGVIMAVVSGPNVIAQLNETCHTINNIAGYQVDSCKTSPHKPSSSMLMLIQVLAGIIAMLIVVAIVLGILLMWKVFHSKKCRTNIEAPTATVPPPSITLTNEPPRERQDQPPPMISPLPNQPDDVTSLSSSRPPPYAQVYVADHTFSQGYGSMASDSASRIASININPSHYTTSQNDDSGITQCILMLPHPPERVVYIVQPVQQTAINSNTLHNNHSSSSVPV